MNINQTNIKIKRENCSIDKKIELHQKHLYLLNKIIIGNISKIEWFEFYFEIEPMYSIEKINLFLDEYYKLKKQNIFFISQFKTSAFIIIKENNKQHFSLYKQFKFFIKLAFNRLFDWFKK